MIEVADAEELGSAQGLEKMRRAITEPREGLAGAIVSFTVEVGRLGDCRE